LVNPSHPFEGAYIIGVLGHQITRMLGLDLAVCLLFLSGLFQGLELVFGEDHALLGDLGL
jgi:hypothetical protein